MKTLLTGMPSITAFVLLAMSSVVADVTEEAAFRGYMQGPERRLSFITFRGLKGPVASLESS